MPQRETACIRLDWGSDNNKTARKPNFESAVCNGCVLNLYENMKRNTRHTTHRSQPASHACRALCHIHTRTSHTRAPTKISRATERSPTPLLCTALLAMREQTRKSNRWPTVAAGGKEGKTKKGKTKKKHEACMYGMCMIYMRKVVAHKTKIIRFRRAQVIVFAQRHESNAHISRGELTAEYYSLP